MIRWFWRQPQEKRVFWTVVIVNAVLVMAIVVFALR
jgi:hypothetical protein